jgi:hypothetical protein
MNHRLLRQLRPWVMAGGFAALPAVAAAQFPPPPPPPGSPPPAIQDRWPQPAQPQRPAQQQQQPTQQQSQQPQQAPPPAQAATPAPAPAAKPRPAPANVVGCSGVFGKDSAHLKLAMRFDSRNVVFTEVDGPDGSKLNASVLYPNDPKRRLEVLWNNEASRSDTALVVINGQSQWTAPKGLKLGMPLATLERLNGRPFKLGAFGADGVAVTDWEGGALSALPGGCKVGIRLVAGRGVPDDARAAVAGEQALSSNDLKLKALKPQVAEILIGY